MERPFVVTEQISPVNNKVRLNRQTSKIYHINMLKKWYDRDINVLDKSDTDKDTKQNKSEMNNNQIYSVACLISSKEDDIDFVNMESPLLVPQESINDVQINISLSENQ